MTYAQYARCNMWDIKVVKEWDRLGIFSDNELRGLGKIRKTSEGTFYVYIDAYLEFGGIDELTTIKIFRFSDENCYSGYLFTLKINREIVLSERIIINWIDIEDPFIEEEYCCNDDKDINNDISHHECSIQ